MLTKLLQKSRQAQFCVYMKNSVNYHVANSQDPTSKFATPYSRILDFDKDQENNVQMHYYQNYLSKFMPDELDWIDVWKTAYQNFTQLEYLYHFWFCGVLYCFKPEWTINYPQQKGPLRYCLEGNMHQEDIQQERRDSQHANYVKVLVQQELQQQKQNQDLIIQDKFIQQSMRRTVRYDIDIDMTKCIYCGFCKACFVSEIGFFTNAYDLFIIQLAFYNDKNGLLQQNGLSLIIKRYFSKLYHDEIRDGDTIIKKLINLSVSETLLKQSVLIGTLIGQLFFGYLADLGRKKIVYNSHFCIRFDTASLNGLTIVGMLIIWRFFLDIGIGGDYPLSAIITSEFANTKNKGAMIAAVFAMQSFGILTGSVVSLIVLLSLSKN